MSSRPHFVMAAALLVFASACASTPDKATTPNKTQAAKTSTAPKKQPDPSPPPGRSKDAPDDVQIGSLSTSVTKTVRVRGIVAKIKGMRLVPPSVIFVVRDSSGSATFVIKEKAKLREGAKMELVGNYKRIPSPMHTGPGKAPEEDVFVVDRYLVMP